MWRAAALALGLSLSLPAAAAATVPVDLELVLAVDISGSVDEEEALLQRQGYVAALIHPEVIAAITSGITGRVAMTYIEWAGQNTQRVVVDWTAVGDAETARDFASAVASAPFATAHWTSISGAIDFALPMFETNGYEGTRRVIDLSGDGPNNSGRLAPEARDAAVAAGVVVNGLPIINGRLSRWGRIPPIAHLDRYYQDCVIGGPGAFIIVANGFEDFARAIRRKLILEIADRQPAPSEQRASADTPRLWLAATDPRPPCNIGERQFEMQMQEMN